MSDSMTKDDVLSALGEISQHFENCAEATYGGSHERFHRWMNAADWAAAYLNDPAPTVGGWISVKDRLPETGRLALVYGSMGAMTIARYIATNEWLVPGIFSTVTHWMPLPEPPEEVSG